MERYRATDIVAIVVLAGESEDGIAEIGADYYAVEEWVGRTRTSVFRGVEFGEIQHGLLEFFAVFVVIVERRFGWRSFIAVDGSDCPLVALRGCGHTACGAHERRPTREPAPSPDLYHSSPIR